MIECGGSRWGNQTPLMMATDEACWYRTSFLEMFQALSMKSSSASRMSVPAIDFIYVVISVTFLVATSAYQQLGWAPYCVSSSYPISERTDGGTNQGWDPSHDEGNLWGKQ